MVAFSTTPFREALKFLSGKAKSGYGTCSKDICDELNDSKLSDLPNKPNTRIGGYGEYSVIKFRVADSGNKRGQSGGFRVYALTSVKANEIVFLFVYPKNEKKRIESLSPAYEKELLKKFIDERQEGKLVRMNLQDNLSVIDEG